MTTAHVTYHFTDATETGSSDLSDPGAPCAVIRLGSIFDDGQLRVIVHDPTECDRIIEAVRGARVALVAAATRDLHADQLV